ncbi:ABC transporter permease [Actinospica sp. MGRD01-02]|uniref:ABC transporter permease n=1 Tax=Actinospica acidithermotolerans TaxID=2828514 RepID=A0A941EI50_9ACTN|nr:ABC transporter permease [Actinospica acidithermotolerans]MBR7830853.1 ABC transporter permease [Actinospica acidithermotolerans]
MSTIPDQEIGTAPAGPEPQLPARSNPVGAIARTLVSRYVIVGVWIALIVVYTAAEPGVFFTGSTFQTIFGSQQALVFLAMALLCTISVGEFVDLSVPSVFGFAATILPVLVVNHGWGVWPAAAVAVLGAVAVGAINGFLVVKMGVNTIVVTLGMSTLLTGISLWMSDMNTISGLPAGFGKIALTDVGGLPISFYYGVVLVLGFAYVLGFTPLGRHMRFVGANREVSRLSGIRVNRIRFGSFVAAGALAGLGAVIDVAALGGFNATTSSSLLLPVFASVFLGTAVVDPGRFNPVGTFVGIYFLATGILGLQLLGLQDWVSSVFYGGVLVLAVTVATVLRRRVS